MNLTGTRQEYIEDLRTSYILGELSVDRDDLRTTAGLTEEEITYIRGEK